MMVILLEYHKVVTLSALVVVELLRKGQIKQKSLSQDLKTVRYGLLRTILGWEFHSADAA